MVCLVLKIKDNKDMDSTFKDFRVVRGETVMKTNITKPPAVCKSGSRFRRWCAYTKKAVICSAWGKAGKASELRVGVEFLRMI